MGEVYNAAPEAFDALRRVCAAPLRFTAEEILQYAVGYIECLQGNLTRLNAVESERDALKKALAKAEILGEEARANATALKYALEKLKQRPLEPTGENMKILMLTEGQLKALSKAVAYGAVEANLGVTLGDDFYSGLKMLLMALKHTEKP